MRNTCALIVSLFLCATLATAATAPRIERRLDTLAASFAKALGDRDFREALQRALASGETGGGIRLRDLLDREVAAGTTVASRLVERLGPGQAKAAAPREAVLRFLASTPEVDVSLIPGPEAWDGASIPLVTYTWEGGGPRESFRAFDASGTALTLDPRQPLERPVVVLEVHNTRDAVEIMSRATPDAGDLGGRGPAGIQEKLYPQCFDWATYSSYPLIVGSSIWDAHEGCCNGPEGFLYFSAAGSEKTGNLPASLGGRSGWSTNVWASNFQGPILVTGNARAQWEWTANGWLQQSSRTYPAVYSRQTASSSAGFALTAYSIKEDDEWPNSDDYVGKVQIDHRYCKSDVFDQGLTSGWSARHTTAGLDDVINTTYDLFCSVSYQCNATVECPNGMQISCAGSGSCGGGSCMAGEDWVQCGGTYQDCSETTTCPRGQIICDPV